MEQNGLRAQVFRDAAGASKTVTQEMMDELERFDKYVANLAQEDQSQDMKLLEFIAGNRNMTVAEIGTENFQEVLSRLNDFKQNLYGNIMQERYFENYVRH